MCMWVLTWQLCGHHISDFFIYQVRKSIKAKEMGFSLKKDNKVDQNFEIDFCLRLFVALVTKPL